MFSTESQPLFPATSDSSPIRAYGQWATDPINVTFCVTDTLLLPKPIKLQLVYAGLQIGLADKSIETIDRILVSTDSQRAPVSKNLPISATSPVSTTFIICVLLLFTHSLQNF